MSLRPTIVLRVAQASLFAAAFSAGFNDIRISENIAVVDVFIVAAAIFAAIHSLARSAVPRVPVWMLFGLGALVFHVLVTTYFSDNAAEQADGAKLILAIGAFPLTTYVVLFRDERALSVAAIAFIAGGVTNALVSYLQVMGIAPPALGHSGREFLGRYSAMTVHPNHLGMHCALALSFALAPVLHARGSRILKLAYWVCVTVLAGGVFVSGSRAAIGASVAVLGVALFISSRHRRRFFVSVLVLGPLLMAVTTTYPSWSAQISEESPLRAVLHSFDRMFGRVDDVAESDAERKDAIVQAIDGWLSAPVFGNGYSDIRAGHNVYLQVLNAAGIVGFAAFFLILIGGLWSSLRLVATSTYSTSRLILLGGAGCIVGYLVFGLVQNGIYDRFLYVPLGLILAAASLHRTRGHVRTCGQDNHRVSSERFFRDDRLLVRRANISR